MIETTETTVATPMMTPRSVRKDRSLLRRRACRATAKSSPKGMSARGSGGAFLLLHLHAIPLLQRPQRLEGAGHDFLAPREPAGDFDLQLACEAQLDGEELRLPVAQDVDARFCLDPSGCGLLPFRRVPHHDGGLWA